MSRSKVKQRSSTQTNPQKYLFNDVKNWKQNVAKNSSLINGSELTTVLQQRRRSSQHRTIDHQTTQSSRRDSLTVANSITQNQ